MLRTLNLSGQLILTEKSLYFDYPQIRIMNSKIQDIESGKFYHVYNRAIGGELLFHSEKDYLHWLDLLKRYLLPVCEIHAYCLLPNHYHLIVRVNANTNPGSFSKSMSNAANAFTKWANLTHNRKGGLFMTPFKRKLIENDAYLTWCLWYIHRNPLHHQYTSNWQTWKYSSYSAYTAGKYTLVTTNFFLSLFGGADALINYHQIQMEDDDAVNSISLE